MRTTFFDVDVRVGGHTVDTGTYAVTLFNHSADTLELQSVTVTPPPLSGLNPVPASGRWILEPGQSKRLLVELQSVRLRGEPPPRWPDEVTVEISFTRRGGNSESRAYCRAVE
ncbi:MAG: hypothetical protein AABO58_13360 [Acidobacteriota bacterium]